MEGSRNGGGDAQTIRRSHRLFQRACAHASGGHLRTPGGQEGQQRTHATAWVPPTDIFARGDDLVIRIDLAGVHPEDVSITFAQGVLTVSGERRTWQGTDGDESFQIRERFYGAFRRAINLPEGTQESQISAEFEDGLLELIVTGGAAAAEPARIAVRAKGKGR